MAFGYKMIDPRYRIQAPRCQKISLFSEECAKILKVQAGVMVATCNQKGKHSNSIVDVVLRPTYHVGSVTTFCSC